MVGVCDKLFNKDPYQQQGGDMVRTGGLVYTCERVAAVPSKVHSMPPKSASVSDRGIALRDYGSTELTAAIEALAMRGSLVHAGIHQARKAIRRTRAMLTLGAPMLGPGAELIDRQLRRVNRRLSPLRDMQALVETVDRLRIKARSESSRSVLDQARRVAARERAAAARTQEFARALKRQSALLITLRAALQGLPWTSLSASLMTEAMNASVTKAEGARQLAFSRDHAEDWHSWRRSMRTISQQHRAAAAAGIDIPASPFDKSIAEQLGVMQDLSLLAAHCSKEFPLPKRDRIALRRFAEQTLVRQRKRIRSVVAPA